MFSSTRSPVLLVWLLLAAFACETPDSPDLELRSSVLTPAIGYEVWASDQSNSVPGEARRGVNGSFIWIWDSDAIAAQLAGIGDAQPLPCAGMDPTGPGPCDVNMVFPADLQEYDADGQATGRTRPQIGRLHGMLVDPQDKYLTANFFAPDGGFLGILDGRSKVAIALFRVSGTSAGRSNHMSFWDQDGSSIIIANLNGKILERVDLTRDADGDIVAASFVEAAGLGLGKAMTIADRPKVYLGSNALGEPLLGSISPGLPDLDELTPTGRCRENGCEAGEDGGAGGRSNNLIICPVPSRRTEHAFVTLAGGGLFVVDHSTTPMTIVAEYGKQVINGAGCGGAEGNHEMFINAGVSASAAGATQSTFTIYALPLEYPDISSVENFPAPTLILRDPGNTATNGSLVGAPSITDGQLPGLTARRDSHGMVTTTKGRYVHTVDRIQNLVEVVRASKNAKPKATYDLTSAGGYGEGEGPCAGFSVTDDPGLPINDPAPDLLDAGPNGELLFVAFRGPVPVSVAHSAQGSCPGVGVVALSQAGKRGRLATVLRTTNTIDTVEAGWAASPGGHAYTGAERSDVHGAIVRRKGELE